MILVLFALTCPVAAQQNKNNAEAVFL